MALLMFEVTTTIVQSSVGPLISELGKTDSFKDTRPREMWFFFCKISSKLCIYLEIVCNATRGRWVYGSQSRQTTQQRLTQSLAFSACNSPLSACQSWGTLIVTWHDATCNDFLSTYLITVFASFTGFQLI